MKSGFFESSATGSFPDIRTALDHLLVEHASEAVYVFDDHSRIVRVNDKAVKDSGFSKPELLGMKITDLDPVFSRPPLSPAVSEDGICQTLSFRAQHKHKSGHLYPVEISLLTLKEHEQNFNAFLARDISMLVEAEESLGLGEESFRVIADTSPVALVISRVSDGLIRYANRQACELFHRTTEELVDSSIMDLFQSYSQDPGLTAMIRSGLDVKNREFLFQDDFRDAMWLLVSTKTLILDKEQVICSALLDVTEAHELSHQLSYQATYDDLTGLVNRREFEDRLQEAIDTACYAAKDSGRNRIHVYHFDDLELEEKHGEMRLVSSINSALDDGRMELWQQSISQVNKLKGTINLGNVHFELLLRMREKDGTLVAPEAFLPSAERYDLATRIDRWVMDAMFNWFEKYPEQLAKLEICAVNLSGQSLGDEKFLKEITDHFTHSNIPAEKVCFEITETAAIHNLQNASQFIKTLKRLGCTFALDDFGSGLSSSAYLKGLPVDFVKIYGFFVKDVVSDPVDLAMVKAINDMAHAMGKLTIAEFVEDREILQKLVDLGVDYVQGYGIAQPMPLINESAE